MKINTEKELKDFIDRRTVDFWNEKKSPYFLSALSPDLKMIDTDYRDIIGSKKLREWVVENEFEKTRVITDPYKQAKVAFVPDYVDYDFVEERTINPLNELKTGKGKRSSALHRFVDELARLPSDSTVDLKIPAKTLIALLNS